MFDNNKDRKFTSISYPTSSYYSSRILNLSWKNISLKMEKRKNNSYFRNFLKGSDIENVQILDEVYGVVTSGTLTAIMGPSGAGKTSLLATISLRVKGKASGEILLNGEPVDVEIMSRMSGFVPQQDFAVESLTVEEHMEFMARMKMDRRISSSVRKQRISILLSDLGLIKCCSTQLTLLSCGERKRVSLAVQLLTEPRVLFCDEPTTGLDSYAAITVSKILKDVANRGCIVICSLHQPASGLLDLFDEIILLSNGRLAFQGSVHEALEFFNSIDIQCPATFNSAEFFVKQLSIDRSKEVESQQKIKWICHEFEKSSHGKHVVKAIDESCTGVPVINAPHPIFSIGLLPACEFEKVRAFTQMQWLIWRVYIDYKRNVSTLLLRFCLYMFISILLSTPFIDATKNIDQKGIQNIQGLLYLIITETIFTFNYSVFYTFPKELHLLLRDIANGLYYPAPYYISKIMISIPSAVIQPFIYTSFIYFVVGLNIEHFNLHLFVLPVILSALSASAIGFLMSAVFESIDAASLLSVPIDFLTLIFSGLFLQLGSLPPLIRWMKYTSQFYYGVEAISLTQWGEIDHISCSENSDEPCLSTGGLVLETYGYNPEHYFVDCLGLVTIFSVSHVAGYLAIRNRCHKQPVY